MDLWDIVNTRQHMHNHHGLIPKQHIVCDSDARVCVRIPRYCFHQVPARGHQGKYNTDIRYIVCSRNISKHVVVLHSNIQLHR